MLNYLKQKSRSFSKTCMTLFKQFCVPHTVNSYYLKIIKTLQSFLFIFLLYLTSIYTILSKQLL